MCFHQYYNLSNKQKYVGRESRAISIYLFTIEINSANISESAWPTDEN